MASVDPMELKMPVPVTVTELDSGVWLGNSSLGRNRAVQMVYGIGHYAGREETNAGKRQGNERRFQKAHRA